MQHRGYIQPNHSGRFIFLLITGLAIAADQISKAWIKSSLIVGQSIPENGFFRITHGYNTGAAFGIFQGQSFVLSILAVAAVIFLISFDFWGYWRFPWLNTGRIRIALGFILGGTAGNLIDRLRLGQVTDLIDIGIWPTFNLADSFIVIGVVVLAFSILRISRNVDFLRQK